MTATTEIQTAQMANGKKAAFESGTCARCGGTGTTPYKWVHGGVCFGCGGTGVKLTKRGAAAAAFYRESLTLPASEIEIGMKVLSEGFTAGSFSQASKWITIDQIENEADLRFGGTILTADAADQILEMVEAGASATPCKSGRNWDVPAFTMHYGLSISGTDKRGERMTWGGVTAEYRMRVAQTGEQKQAKMAAAKAYELTLTKSGTVRKAARAA